MNQEVVLRKGPLGKLGCFESTAEIFFVYIASISLESGPIQCITSWYTKFSSIDPKEKHTTFYSIDILIEFKSKALRIIFGSAEYVFRNYNNMCLVYLKDLGRIQNM